MKIAKAYQVKTKKLEGTHYDRVYRKAFEIYFNIRKRSKRRVYIRSAYFNKNKVSLSLFWQHLADKYHRERVIRLRYFPCALDLILHSKFDPISAENFGKKSEILHRFSGATLDGDIFYVQIKENIKNGQKFLISIFTNNR